RADHRPVSAIRVTDLHKSYGEHEALRGISFTIDEGEVFSLLGPNGAGKTTTVEILEGYRARDGGAVEVLGFDPARAQTAYRQPTTGFGPAARRAAWEMIRSLRSLGKTILLTTHYLDEAEQLADRVAVLREGRIIGEGTPAELTGGTQETEIRYRRDGQEVLVRTTEPTRLLHQLTEEAIAEGRELEG